MKRRPLNEVDTNKGPAFRVEDDDQNIRMTRSRKRMVPGINALDVFNEEEIEEEEHRSDSKETSTQESHEATGLKRPKRSSVTKRILAPAPATDGWAVAARSSVGESAAAAAAPTVPPAAPARTRTYTRSWTRSSIGGSVLDIPPNVEDIDRRRQNDPNYATAYASDAYSFLRELQFKYGKVTSRTPRSCLPESRERTVDWMISVVEDFAMSSDVLFLSVSIMDRAFQLRSFPASEYRLVACASMLLASKYEDVFSPSLAEFVQSTSEPRQTRGDILRMEDQLLKLLDYRLMIATMKPFLRRFQRAAAVTMDEKVLSNFIAEMSLINWFYLRYTPSLMAAASVYVARFVLYKIFEGGVIHNANGDEVPTPALWTEELRFYSEYDAPELYLVVQTLFLDLKSIHDGRELYSEAIQRKYRSELNLRKYPLARLVSLLPHPTSRSIEEGGR